MLYKKSQQRELDRQLFENPSSEYRAAPFWAWNCRLQKEQLLSQISELKDMGMGGFHIHCRVGLDTPYLGEEFFEDVEACAAKAKEDNMLCWLYDEDRWPSGSAGGLVTKDEKYRSRFLVFVPAGYEEENEETAVMAAAKAVRSNNRRLLARYEVELSGQGYLKSYRRLEDQDAKEEDEPSGEAAGCQVSQDGGVRSEGDNIQIWEAYLEISGPTPWFNDQTYVNTLDKAAIDRFIEVTHEAYYSHLKEDFGNTVPSIFTDEPQISHKEIMDDPFDKKPVIMPFTDDMEETFRKRFGRSLLAHLPELIWEQPEGRVSQIRYLYHVHACERFSEAFGDNIGKWCEDHGIALTGHMMSEWTLYSQTLTVGEVMRPMKHFGLPGVDMLCDRREYSTVKQAQSVAHQCGREGVMCEIYGVTGWDFDFRSHKLAGDWQAALGVTVRVPHLTWVSMEGEAKRDYPASIGHQSTWYREYPYIENHFARLNTALTRGVPEVHIGVIHPIESYWMYWGNRKQTSVVRQELEANFDGLIRWLLFGLLDFDFISEAMLSEDKSVCDGPVFPIGSMRYDVVVVPQCRTLRRTTLKRLKDFKEKGGKVIFMGEAPSFIDGLPCTEGSELAARCENIPYSCSYLLEALEPWREVDIVVQAIDGQDPSKIKHIETGLRADNLFYQMRRDQKNKWLFICHVNKAVNEHIAYTEKWEIEIKGNYTLTAYDTMTGSVYPMEVRHEAGVTKTEYYTSQHGSLLLKLEPTMQETAEQKPGIHLPPLGGETCTEAVHGENYPYAEKHLLPRPLGYTLEEPNVFLLDQAEYAFDDGEWREKEELLRIDNLFRRQLGYPLRLEALAQPWTQPEAGKISHMLHLRFAIPSEIGLEQIELAMEYLDNAVITWNRVEVKKKTKGWFVDNCLKKVELPGLLTGENVLELSIPFGQKTNVEWCYLLGNFGVYAAGNYARITKKPAQLYYGDFVHQGLPFYAGNLVYEVPLTCEAGRLNLEISHYRGALVQIELDGEKKGNIVLAPYRLCCGYVEAGEHKLRIRVFGNRVNAFGPLHNADASEKWHGPDIWRTVGNKWSYEYQFKEMGVLTTPRYWIEK